MRGELADDRDGARADDDAAGGVLALVQAAGKRGDERLGPSARDGAQRER